MSITLTGTSSGDQGLFNRLGALFYLLQVTNTFRGGTSAGDLPKEIEDAQALFAGADPEYIAQAGNLYSALVSAQSGLGGFASQLRTAANDLLIEQVDADNPLAQRNAAYALAELISQMDGSATVDANEPGSSIAAGGSNEGDGTLVCSLLTGRGQTMEHVIPEVIDLVCTSTSTAGSEQFTAEGEAKVSSELSQAWPGGSGFKKTLSSTLSGATANQLTNGGFETASGSGAASWDVDTGSAGTDQSRQTGTKYLGTAAYQFAGDGSTLSAISQTLTGLSARTPYAFHLRASVSSAPAAGVLQVDLYDGSSVIDDEEGNANSFTVDLTGLTSSWTAHTGVFRLPDPLPATVKLRIHLTTAITNTHDLQFDEAQLKAMTRLGNGAPYFALFGGAANWGLGDLIRATITNDFRGGFQTWFGRVWPTMRTSDLFLPSATGGSESIDDALIA